MARPHRHSPQCRDLLAQISDYIDGELEERLCTELERHLADCQDCRVLVDTTQKTVALYRHHYRHQPVPLSPEATSRLWQALDEAGCLEEEP